jgi:hypothetical protein
MKYTLKIPERDLIWISKLRTPKQITNQLKRFHKDLGVELKKREGKEVEELHTARYIIATSASFSVGITLNEAISICFLEPDYRPHTMKQGYARHTRNGNPNKLVHSWLLTAKGNAQEERILEVNAVRANITAATKRTLQETQKPPTTTSSSVQPPTGTSSSVPPDAIELDEDLYNED